jgi:endonuclease YncB( thermonuclease family)
MWTPHVIDGDTIDWNGQRWRMANYDAPEIDGHCARERDLAWRAKRRLGSV